MTQSEPSFPVVNWVKVVTPYEAVQTLSLKNPFELKSGVKYSLETDEPMTLWRNSTMCLLNEKLEELAVLPVKDFHIPGLLDSMPKKLFEKITMELSSNPDWDEDDEDDEPDPRPSLRNPPRRKSR